jgi:excisionase family DNA binding protein
MKPHEPKSRLLTVEEAAERLGVKPSTIRSWILKREKLEVVKVGRLVRIKEKSIGRFIDQHTITPKEGSRKLNIHIWGKLWGAEVTTRVDNH